MQGIKSPFSKRVCQLGGVGWLFVGIRTEGCWFGLVGMY